MGLYTILKKRYLMKPSVKEGEKKPKPPAIMDFKKRVKKKVT